MSTIELVSTLAAQIAAIPFQFVQFVGFWMSVSLPLFYIPLLYQGMELGVTVFVGVLAVHVVSLVLGHGYGREDAGTGTGADTDASA
ncbi:hypothetical protein [Haladaptatus sp. NG-SE-30]